MQEGYIRVDAVGAFAPKIFDQNPIDAYDFNPWVLRKCEKLHPQSSTTDNTSVMEELYLHTLRKRLIFSFVTG